MLLKNTKYKSHKANKNTMLNNTEYKSYKASKNMLLNNNKYKSYKVNKNIFLNNIKYKNCKANKMLKKWEIYIKKRKKCTNLFAIFFPACYNQNIWKKKEEF